MQSKYVLERVSHAVVKLGEANYWDDMYWKRQYWDLVYKRGRYVSYLRELNETQAARIMELEHQLRMKEKP